MKEKDYLKIFEHFTDLSQRYAMGKIQHDALREGLKKLITEVVTAEAEKKRRSAFWLGFALCAVIIALVGVLGCFLWKYGLIQAWIKNSGF
jgi:hypothetical protein